MKISKIKLELILARKCMTITSLRPGISPQTLAKLNRELEIRPEVVGRIAKALNVDPADIIQEGA